MHTRAALLLGIAVAFGARRAGAEPRTSSLAWARLSGAESCVGARELARAVEARLGRKAFVSPADAGLSLEGYAAPKPGGGFHVHIGLNDERGGAIGTRELEGDGADCHALDEDIALVVALLLDPDVALGRKPAPFVTPPLLPAPRVIVERVYVPVASPPARTPWRVEVTAGPAFAAGLVPGVAVGVALGGAFTPPRLFPVTFGGAVWKDARATRGAEGVAVSLSYASLGACPLDLGRAGTRARACVAGVLGAVHAEGFGFTHIEAEESAVFDVALEGRFSQRVIGPLDVHVGVAAALGLARARFFYVDAAGTQQEIYRSGAVAGVADAGIGLSF